MTAMLYLPNRQPLRHPFHYVLRVGDDHPTDPVVQHLEAHGAARSVVTDHLQPLQHSQQLCPLTRPPLSVHGVVHVQRPLRLLSRLHRDADASLSVMPPVPEAGAVCEDEAALVTSLFVLSPVIEVPAAQPKKSPQSGHFTISLSLSIGSKSLTKQSARPLRPNTPSV